ncbi:ATP-binding cassette domain-containing protein [Alicyclobacillus mali]|uniref:ATP-binding cassette domain-containing protein n=1 Tax=Alicyclobacillus mali (ex Roth et al. 2021) TaxID=1123961 RepID=A0ABS0F1Z3_9BACL|nr:ATP-binding cassette domain-containing protein [Alicyclobacillus mali (ex Roth et al. 2021)]MBF8377331.1 ATP-binding cassette domain-containing protein [Alicyclobacillus mali (ex Roth et al. 2021)]
MAVGNKGVSVRLVGVQKVYGQRVVLDDLDLRIGKGEFIAIVGHSGTGKSTLLRLLAGLEQPTRGDVLIDDSPVTGLTPTARVMFQDARLLPWLSVFDNVAVVLPKPDKLQVEQALDRVGLLEHRHKWPAQLSGGQRQRVALARALVVRPPLLLLDEPLGALDALTRLEMQSLIESLWREERFTAVLVTHDVSEAVRLADRVICIADGRVSLDLEVPLPRPRDRSSSFLRLESKVLATILGRGSADDNEAHRVGSRGAAPMEA